MKAAQLGQAQIDSVAQMFRILGDPMRLRILQRLKESPAIVSELVDALEAKQANVSKQLGILHTAGLVARTREGNQVRYAIKEPMIFDLCGLVCDKLQRDAEATLAALRRR